MIGCANSATTITNCSVQNCSITSSNSSSSSSGGLIGYAYSTTTITNCSVQNCSITITSYSSSYSGGLIGNAYSTNITSSGSCNSKINGSYAGGIAGYATNTNCNETFSNGNGMVNASNSAGGLFGQLSINTISSFQISNSYNIVPVIGNITGGLIGEIIFNVSSNSILNISNCYSSSPISKFGVSSIVGLAVGCIPPQTTNFTFFSQVFCNNQTNNSLPLIGKGSFSNLSTIESLSCSQLYSKVNSFFNHEIWGGNRLLIEPHYSYGICNCLSGCPTNIPTTNNPTTNIPTTNIPTTNIPSTNIPTTNTTTTNIPTTNIPTTNIPTSDAPTTNTPTTNTPTTNIPTSNTQTIQTLPYTFLSSSYFPTVSLLNCIYQISNCHLCPFDAPLFDLTQGNVSCIFFQNEWRWTFTPNNGTLTNTGEIVVSGNTTTIFIGNLNNNANLSVSSNSSLVVQGNMTNNANLNISTQSTIVIGGVFIQSSGGKTTFTFNPSYSNYSHTSIPLKVSGCVEINGNISLNLQTQPQQGTTNLQVMSYNGTQQVNISSSQIQVIPNYNGSSCDTINSQTINQPNSLAVPLTSTLGNKCSGSSNLGLIIGLSVGIPCILIAFISVVIVVLKFNQRRKMKRVKIENEMHRMNNEKFVENSSYGATGTQWTNNSTLQN